MSSSPEGGSGLPTWIASGILGIAIGAGGTYLGLKSSVEENSQSVPVDSASASAPPAPPMMGGMGGMGMGGGMGGMGMGMGMGGGMGGGREKRNLTSIVGRVELLTRKDLHVELTPEQTAKFAAKLTELNGLEKLNGDDAKKQLEEIESILTPEQKAIVDSIGLPFGGRPGGGPGGPGGGPGGPGGGPGGPGGGPPAEDENPFRQDANQKRLKDLLDRLQPATN